MGKLDKHLKKMTLLQKVISVMMIAMFALQIMNAIGGRFKILQKRGWKMTGKIIIKNADCKFFEGQTGLCKAKEFTICNPINCKLYTIDELSTILELQKKLQAKEQLSVKQSHELIRLRKERQENKQKNVNLLQKNEELEKQLENEKQALDEIENYVRDNSDFDKNDKLTSNTGAYDILEIINKAKAVSNAR